MSLLQFFGCLVVGAALLPLTIVAFLYVEDALARGLQMIVRRVSIGRSGSTPVQDDARRVVVRPGDRGRHERSGQCGCSAPGSARLATLDRSRNARCWREVAEGIVLEDQAIHSALEQAKAALDGDRRCVDGCVDGREHQRLDAIGEYSAFVARQARAATGAIDCVSPDIERIASLGCPHGHLRTLRVLGDVLRTTAPRRFESR